MALKADQRYTFMPEPPEPPCISHSWDKPLPPPPPPPKDKRFKF